MRREVIDRVIDGFDKLNEKVKNSYDNFNHYNSVLEKYKNITDLMGVSLNQQNQELLEALGRATLANAENQAAAAREIYDKAIEMNRQAQAAYDEKVAQYGANSPEAQEYERLLQETQENVEEAQLQWLDAYSQALEIAKELYLNKIEHIYKPPMIELIRLMISIYKILKNFMN